MSIPSYLAYVTKIADALRSIGERVLDYEFILHVLGGLESDYEALVTVVTSQTRHW